MDGIASVSAFWRCKGERDDDEHENGEDRDHSPGFIDRLGIAGLFDQWQ